MLITAIIFFLTYTAIAIGRVPGFRIDRTGAALIGATLLLVFHCITFEEAYQALNYRTLMLLFGMMLVIANLRLSGFFDGLEFGLCNARRVRITCCLPLF